MSQVINTNVMSLNAQRNLMNTGSALATSLERLSSGLRINSAKDDAAGLAVSERFTTQIRGLNQAIRNSNDGISLAQTGEGALAEITNNLQRIRELAVQSANATNSDSDRAALNLEVEQRLAEIDRIAGQTSFNGRNILDGSFGDAAFQVGANVGQTIDLSLQTSMRTGDIGAVAETQSLNRIGSLSNESGASGAYTDSVSVAAGQSQDGERYSLSVGDIEILTQQQTNLTASAGAYTAAAITAGGDADNTITVSVSLADASGTDFDTVGFEFTATGATATVTAANMDTALNAALADGTLDGFTTIGSFAGGNLQFVRADGQQFTATMSTSTVSGDATALTVTNASTGGANLAAGATSTTGTQITITGADIDTAITSKLGALNDAGITVAGTAAADTLVFSRGDGEAFDISLSNDFTTVGGFAGGDAFGSGASLTNGTITIDNAEDLVLAAGEFTVRVGDGEDVNVAGTFSSVQDLVDGVNTALAGNGTAVLDDGGRSFTITASDNLRLGGSSIDDIFATANQSVDAAGSLKDVNVRSVDAANNTISRIDASLTEVSSLRSTFGAIQNRFESTIANLSTTVENLSASRSRILDTDFAAETANLTRAQILQQAGTAMLAQANQMPQNVLSLLR